MRRPESTLHGGQEGFSEEEVLELGAQGRGGIRWVKAQGGSPLVAVGTACVTSPRTPLLGTMEAMSSPEIVTCPPPPAGTSYVPLRPL